MEYWQKRVKDEPVSVAKDSADPEGSSTSRWNPKLSDVSIASIMFKIFGSGLLLLSIFQKYILITNIIWQSSQNLPDNGVVMVYFLIFIVWLASDLVFFGWLIGSKKYPRSLMVAGMIAFVFFLLFGTIGLGFLLP